MKHIKKLAIASIVTAVAGFTFTACGSEHKLVGSMAGEAAPAAEKVESTTAEDEIAMLDIVWSSESDAVCDAWNDLSPSLQDSAGMEQFMLDKFEEGYGKPLSPAAAAHLVDLVHSC